MKNNTVKIDNRELLGKLVHIAVPIAIQGVVSAPLEVAFKATQQTRIPMIVSTVVFSTNTFLNYVFIFGKFGAPAMGVAGAALATAIARGAEVFINVAAASYQAAAAINSIFSFAAFFVGDAALILGGASLGEGNKDYAFALAGNPPVKPL